MTLEEFLVDFPNTTVKVNAANGGGYRVTTHNFCLCWGDTIPEALDALSDAIRGEPSKKVRTWTLPDDDVAMAYDHGVAMAYDYRSPPVLFAFCFASGLVEFGYKCPAGAIAIMKGPDPKVRETMSSTCRIGYDGKQLLVPGVPEAANRDDAREALADFVEWIARSLPNGCETLFARLSPAEATNAAMAQRASERLTRSLADRLLPSHKKAVGKSAG